MSTDAPQSTKRTVAKLALVAVGMFGFGYALVPLYDKFCEITGLGGRTGDAVAEIADAPDSDRTVQVHFDSNVNSALDWEFKPVEKFMDVQPGRMYETTYIAHNRTDQTIVAAAVPSVAPGQASLYFNKTECFCFEKQLLGPGESREMPVRFFVDDHLPGKIDLITLSYIIYKNEDETERVAVAGP